MNVARYYHHETVCIGRKDNDINSNVRKGLDIMKATDAFRHASATSNAENMMPPPSTSGSRSRSTARKRSSSSLNALLPPNKRLCSTSPHADKGRSELPNRIHRRIILRDYGKYIYKASSRVAMLAALEGNITGMRYSRDSSIQTNRNRA